MNTMFHRGLLVFVLGTTAAGVAVFPAAAASHEATEFAHTSATTVAEAQEILQHLGHLKVGSYKRGEVDRTTIDALMAFQRTHTLKPTGRVDGETMAQLLQHRPVATGVPLALRDVNFETDSARLKPESREALNMVVRSLKANPHVHIELAGHADSTGTADVNRRLSKARADAVRDYLVSRGVLASRLETRGYGSRRPIADNGTRAGRAENRRVDMTWFG